jgi:hypothetical protein
VNQQYKFSFVNGVAVGIAVGVTDGGSIAGQPVMSMQKKARNEKVMIVKIFCVILSPPFHFCILKKSYVEQ